MATDISTESEDFPDSFTCSICLDLLHKPVVLACGHVSCFWCVHKSMNSRSQSYCPICRHPYHHFPTISQTLHFLLLKLYPIAYMRREEQILVEEKKRGSFSPQFDSNAHKEDDRNKHLHPSCTTSEFKSFSNPSLMGNEEPNGSCKQLSITDVECSSCKQLLFHPVFLNCGHGYCETCISCPDIKMPKCQLCQSLHPAGVLKVCLELHHFLEKHFPVEYALRREAVQLKQVQFKNEKDIRNGGSSLCNKNDLPSPLVKNKVGSRSKVHCGIGCDYCGIYPIIGERYKCLDCVEIIGFDLCGNCYNSCSKLPGRFNQQHRPEHKFELVDLNHRQILLGRLEEFHTALTNFIGAISTPENGSGDSSPANPEAEGNAGNS